LICGSLYGAFAGLSGRRTDEIMMRAVDLCFALPYMFLIILLMTFFGQSLLLLFLAIGFVEWLPLSRIVRAGVHNLRDEPYLEAARMMGGKRLYVLWQHLIPQLGAPMIIYATLMLPVVMMQEAFLSFLGLGVPPPMASWGTLIANGVQRIDTAPWILIASAGSLAIWLGCLYAAGDRLARSLNLGRSTGVTDPSLAAVDLGHLEQREKGAAE
jgi:oligopeptide transport system permease protein